MKKIGNTINKCLPNPSFDKKHFYNGFCRLFLFLVCCYMNRLVYKSSVFIGGFSECSRMNAEYRKNILYLCYPFRRISGQKNDFTH
jgi:hypothetical protein